MAGKITLTVAENTTKHTKTISIITHHKGIQTAITVQTSEKEFPLVFKIISDYIE